MTDEAQSLGVSIKWGKNSHVWLQLEEDVVNGVIPDKPEAAWKSCQEYMEMDKKLFKSRLAGMRKGLSKRDGKLLSRVEKEKKNARPWTEKNPVRQQMQQDVRDGTILPEMTFQEARQSRPEYTESMTSDQFKSRLSSMRDIVAKKLARAAEDAVDLCHDRQLHPRPETNGKGEPNWVDSEAKALLELDMENGLHKKMKPKELYLTRYQYKEFELKTFRDHIYQEEHTMKWRTQWVDGKKEYALVDEINF